ncbi:uncharacterized protein LOC143474894 isoform X3 [Brachyhypopomus gauderio]|uniref:uncharacterized protein LOC143474894 isoform X3 n=1 Tax=Brachyhypopomus gauderio TaxID=698409 RepID=UPI0040430D25
MARERAAFFSQFEQEIILKTFEEYKAIITAKCNTAAAAKSRVEAWQKIAERLNASNPSNVKRTWQQVKVKYKNIVQCGKCLMLFCCVLPAAVYVKCVLGLLANRKRAQKQRLGGGLAMIGFTPAEAQVLWQIRGHPSKDGLTCGSSSEQAGVRSPSSTGFCAISRPSTLIRTMMRRTSWCARILKRGVRNTKRNLVWLVLASLPTMRYLLVQKVAR